MNDQINNTVDLKPCPFCGGNVHYSGGDSAHIVCLNPGCDVLDITLRASFNSFDELARQWNRRA